MKQYLVLSSLAIMLLSSCGSNSNENGLVLGEKKAALEKLKSQKATLDEQIKKMEGEIDLLDSTKAGAQKPKLVSVQTLQLASFDHFIELQGRIDAENISIITPRGAPGQVKKIFVQKGSYVKKGQLLLSLSSIDFSFIMEENISEIFSLLYQFKIKTSLIQNSAISFSVCIEDKFDNFSKAKTILSKKFKVAYNENVSLYTIRHFNQATAELVEKDKTVLIRQISRETMQIVTKE